MKRSLLILASFLVLLTSKAMAWEAGDVVYNNLHEGRTQILKVIDRKKDLYLVRILEGDRAGKTLEMIAGDNFEQLTSEFGEHRSQIIRASGSTAAACAETLYSELGIFESDAERACQYGRDTQFLTCTVNLARSIGDGYVAAAGYFCSQRLTSNSLNCATNLYLRGGQNGDKAVALCKNGVNAQLNNCILENFRSGKRSAESAREYCQSQFDPAVIAAREAAAKAARERAEAERRAAEEARQRLEAAKRAAEEARRQQAEADKRKIEEARRQADEIRKQEQEKIAAARKEAEEIRRKQQQDAALEEQIRKIQEEARKQETAKKQAEAPKQTEVKKQTETKKAEPVKQAEPKKTTPTVTTPAPKKTAPPVKVDEDNLPPLPHQPVPQKSSQSSKDQKSNAEGEEGGIVLDLPLE